MIASRFVSNRAQLPVLGNTMLTAKNNKLLVSATNLESSINLSVGAKVEKDGDITVPARTINDIVSNLPAGPINIEVDKEQILITSRNYSSRVSGMNSADFPSVPQGVGKGSIKFPRKELVESIGKVIFSSSADETRPILTGVLFILKKGSVTFVSTDGFRLSERSRVLGNIKLTQDVILPKAVLSELVRLGGESDEISFSYSKKDNQVVFGVDGMILASRILAGEFPDYKKRIPSASKIKVNLDKEEFARAVKLSGIFAKDSANVVKLKVGKDAVEFEAQSKSSGSQETKVDAKVDGGELEIAFNFKFLDEVLNVIEGDEVQLELNDASSPGVFKDPKVKDFLHLIMPVKVQD